MIEGKKFFAIRGYMKSGTNWVGRLLNLHPQISCTGEFHWERISSQLIATVNESENLYEQEGLLHKIWHQMDRFIKESMVLANDAQALWIGDRTPSHIEPSVILGARVFNLIRDGRDVLVSEAHHFFNNPDIYPSYAGMDQMKVRINQFRADSNFFIRNPLELLACDEFVRDSAFFWDETIRRNQEVIDSHRDMQCMEVRYELVHQDTESWRRRMYEFLNVDPSRAAPLTFNTVAGFDKEMPNQFRRKGAVGDWRNYVTPRAREIFNEVAGASLVRLGYAKSLDWETFVNSDGARSDQPPVAPEPATVVRPEATAANLPAIKKSTVKSDSKEVAATVSKMSKARALLAYGGLDGVVQRPMFDHDGGVFPHFAIKAEGYRIFDSVGQEYIDWMNGWGPNLLGYNRPEVVEAIKKQMSAGPTLSLMHPIEIEVAELLVDMIPCAEMVAFGKNGSDAVNASLRIARAVTGRQMILQSGFHGFHEWYTCLHPDVKGMPNGLREQVEPFPYNDLEALERLLIRHQDGVAAVIMEPVNLQLPDEGYLSGVRQLTRKYGCLLIYDEIVTAFRLANGGAQEYFGVTPDLACIGKGMGNGMPLSAVVGKRTYMQALPECGFGMTFRGETFSLAAAKTVLEFIRREPVCEHLADVGRKVKEQFNQVCEKVGVDCRLAGPESRMTFEFHGLETSAKHRIRNLFLQECLKNGVITCGTLLPSYAHDDAAIEASMETFEIAMRIVADAIEFGRTDDSRPLGGSPSGPRAFVSTGFLEKISQEDEFVKIQGWLMLEDGAPDSVELVSVNGDVVPASCVRRPDLEAGFPKQPSAVMAGYEARLPDEVFRVEGNYEFAIVAKRSGQVAFRCLVVQQNVDTQTKRDAGPFSTNDGVLYI